MLPCDVFLPDLFLCILSLSNLPLQDYLFRLVPGYVDSGKGKCSYDPTQENIAVLISKTRFIYRRKKNPSTKYLVLNVFCYRITKSYLSILSLSHLYRW